MGSIGHRKSIRLKGYDYSWVGSYFITICTQDKCCLLGEIKNGDVIQNPAGEMVSYWFREMENKFPSLCCGSFVCMPNHVHFILFHRGRMLLDSSDAPNVSLAEEIHWFKTMTTNMYIRSVKEEGWPPFSGRFWQRNYWEHIIRSDEELYQVRDYIRLNPVKWEEDSLNSFCGK